MQLSEKNNVVSDRTDDMWLKVFFVGLRDHFVFKSAAADLIVDLISRGCTPDNLSKNHRANNIFIELGDLNLVEDLVTKIKLDGLSIEFHTVHIQRLISCMTNSKKQVFKSGREYYKIKFYNCVIVFSIQQFSLLLDELKMIKTSSH